MDSKRQQEYDKKLSSLQESMPFLLRVLEKLRNNNLSDSSRQTQLEKMQKLYNLLNDKTQTLKWETLVKCETVVNKLQMKMEHQTDIDLKILGRITPVNKNITPLAVNTTKDIIDVAGPESPPPQEEDDTEFNAQPVEIPTERRCSPPISIPLHQKDSHQSHFRHNNHQHQSNHHSRHHKMSSSSSRALYNNRHSHNNDHHLNFLMEREKNRERERPEGSETSRNKDFNLKNQKKSSQHRFDNNELYSPEEVWDSHNYDSRRRNIQPSSPMDSDFDPVIIFNPSKKLNTLPHQSTVFNRLGAKPLPSDASPESPPPFENVQINTQNNRMPKSASSSAKSSKSFSSSKSRPTPLNVKEASIFTPDLLKSPPLTATDISQLLNDNNSNSNSNMSDSPSISEVGTRRSTPIPTRGGGGNGANMSTQQQSSLDMVRKKFAMLTKREASTLDDTPSSSKGATNSMEKLQKQMVTVPSNKNTKDLPTERIALKYNPHPRSSGTNTPSKSLSSTTQVQHTVINILPTLRPNDPRLRAGSLINGDITSIAQSGRQISSSKLDSISSNTPSPIYGNSISNIPRSTLPVTSTLLTSQPKPIDPRLRRSVCPPALTSTNVSGDSSEENWDADENPESFKQHGPISDPLFLTGDKMPPDHNINRFGNTSTSSITVRRKSTCWDNNSPPIINPTKCSPQEDRNTHTSNHWFGNQSARPYNPNFPPPSPTTTATINDRFNPALNMQSERFKYLKAKQQKESYEPRTYGAYKVAKARAAAEKRTIPNSAEQFNTEKTNIEVIKHNESKGEEIGDLNSSSVSIANTTLDTLYRNNNLKHCELPKTIGSFKIPKKQISTPKEDKEVMSELPKVGDCKKDKADETFSQANQNPKEDAKEYNVNILKKSAQPKPQRSCFSKQSKNCTKEAATTTTDSSKPQDHNNFVAEIASDTRKIHSFEDGDGDQKAVDEVTISGAEVGKMNSSKLSLEPASQEKSAAQMKMNLALLQPGRILRRRCTMFDQASTPEVDKEKLLQSNAMLFEDLQERERKKKLGVASKTQPNRRHVGEICYERTDDGCTVSTQNILTGKRRTRTTANFNEVQQGIAVFKHIKQTDEKKDTTTTAETKGGKKGESQTTPSVKGKPGPKSKIKAETKSEEVAIKQAEETGAKIKKRRKTVVETDTDAKVMKIDKTEAELNTSVPNVADIFESFIQKILHPDTNADELINKLRDILNEKEVEALLNVRSKIMKKQQESGEMAEEKKKINKMDSEIKEMTSTNSSEVKVMTQPAPAGTSKPKTPRRNELDRLHEDIRDMFISEGVLTATGKRMSTFVEPRGSPKGSSPESGVNKLNEEPMISKVKQKSPATSPVVPIPPPNKRRGRPALLATKTPPPTRTATRRSLRKQDVKADASLDIELEENEANNSFSSANTEISTGSENSTNSSSSYTKSDLEPLKNLPVSKVVDPVRLPEEDKLVDRTLKRKTGISPETVVKQDAGVAKKRYKPCPKSKKPPEELILQQDDKDENESVGEAGNSENNEVAGISPAGNESPTTFGTTPSPKIKSEFDISVPIEVPISHSSSKTLKNINPKWHGQSRYAHWCVICNHKVKFLAMHYKKQHNEHYASRLAPSILHQLRQENAPLNKVILILKNKKHAPKPLFLYRCPFCLQYKRTVMTSWLEHFIGHTGEYGYECSICHQSVNKLNLIEKHLKEKCARLGGNFIQNDEFSLSTQLTEVKAYVCHLCNFIRLGRKSLERHYVEQHEYSAQNVDHNLGYTIILMDCKNVPVVETLETVIQKETQLNEMNNSQIINLCNTDEQDEKVDHANSDLVLPLNDIFEMKVEEAPVQTKLTPENKENTALVCLKGVNVQTESVDNKVNKAIQPHPPLESTEAVLLNQSETAEDISNTSDHKTDIKSVNLIPNVKVSLPPSSVFLSTTDDSNDGETSSAVLARKLLTVDDSTGLDSSPIKAGKSTISIAERLSQRFKEAEATAITTSPTIATTTTTVLAKKLLKLDESNFLENINSTETWNSRLVSENLNQLHKEVEKDSKTTTMFTDKRVSSIFEHSNSVSAVSSESYVSESSEMIPATEKDPLDINSEIDCNEAMNDEGDMEINEEDDDGWEDIEIVETAPSINSLNSSLVNKDSKPSKCKINALHKFSRLYASIAPVPKSRKKFRPFKLIANDNSSSNASDSIKMKNESDSMENLTPTPNSTAQSSNLNKKRFLGFRPVVENLADLLPASPCNDPIELAPELALSSPLPELTDITTLLGSNLNGLMDIDVEEPSNSVCIHNTDNHQTSIQEALDYVNAQEDNFSLDATTAQRVTLSSTNNSTAPAATSVTTMNRIQNIGFNCISTTTEANGFKFFCFTERCTFLYSSEAIGLQNHYLFEHSLAKWNGFCNTCVSQVKSAVDAQEFPISDEFNHMLNVHIKPQNVTNIASSNSTTQSDGIIVESNDSDTLAQRETPRIKLRRLSGDCLSTMTLNSDSNLSTALANALDDSNGSFSELIRFNTRTITLSSEDSVPPLEDTDPAMITEVPLFKNVSKDFEITTISSGLELSEISEIVSNVCKVPLTTDLDRDSPNIQTNVLPLLISSVESLNNNSVTQLQEINNTIPVISTPSLPKITNVCSLNVNQSTNKDVSLWTQETNEDCIEIQPTSTKSKGNDDIVANAQRQNLFPNNAPLQNRPESPDAMIVAETLPVARATTGDFVITQTVSAQYGEETSGNGNGISKLGFNISISSATPKSPLTSNPPTVAIPKKNISSNIATEVSNTPPKLNSLPKLSLQCMENACKFETRHFVAMIDHIKMHESLSDPTQQEYLRCSVCSLLTTSIDDFTQHVRVVHFGATSPATTPTVISKSLTSTSTTTTIPTPTPVTKTACALTERIRNILGKNQLDVATNEDSSNQNSTSDGGVDPTAAAENIAFKEQLLETINEMVSKTGLSENALYCCLVKDCNVKLNESTYHTHVLYHLTTTGAAKNADGNTPLSCPHCVKVFQNLTGLKMHLKSHGQHRFFCWMCMETAANPAQISQHFAQKHWIRKELNATILLKTENCMGEEITYYVTNKMSMMESEILDFGKKLILEWQRKKAANRTHFYPHEYQLLPLHAIFSKEIFCILCLYKTKVRTNMVRHMMMHNSECDGGKGTTDVNNTRKDGISSGLQTVIVGNMDPVNPVPCLSSTERHFDRMTNLASSSLGTAAGGSGTGDTSVAIGCKLRFGYIPMTRRFTCGVPGCQYLTISEEIFRSHLNTLHCDIRSYKCTFCKENLCKRTLAVERILQHLRFHDRTLYQCEQCDHSHYIRYVVERHALEKHGSVPRARISMFVRSEDGEIEGKQTILVAFGKQFKDSNKSDTTLDMKQNSSAGGNVNAVDPIATTPAIQPKAAAQKFPKFICDLCNHKTITYNQIIAHCNSKHGFKKPFQCPHCIRFTGWSETDIKNHIKENHPGNELRASQIFHKMNSDEQRKAQQEFLEQQQLNTNEINTKPLWQRDDPSRVRQIRGIPMEDEEESERLSKRLRLSEDFDDNEDDDGKLSGQSSVKLFLSRFEFGCFHCEYKTNNLDELRKTHWETQHNAKDVMSKPYLFRILIRVRCPECRDFVGCGWELKNHFKTVHQKTNYIAADVRAKLLVCGYCEFQCASPTQLLRHHQREEHRLTDVKCLTAYEMAQIIRLEHSEPEKIITYVHCSLCFELFSTRKSVVQHAREKHKDDGERFSFREMTNTTIYRCSECTYTSTSELITLRHMINHFSRFKRCHFCQQPQTTFNGYMQHCYSDHRAEIRRFSDIYPLSDIRKFLLQLLIIFPNGWIINKKNLKSTPYGNEERIKLLYDEICKTSQEPPIPRLSLGRLVARKSIEAKQQQIEASDASPTVAVMQLAGNSGGVGSHKQTLNARKISKRRSTIACGNEEMGSSAKHLIGGKKQKVSMPVVENRSTKLPTIPKALPPKFRSPTPIAKIPKEDNKRKSVELDPPYSYYGKKPDVEDWSKIFTKISIAGVNTPISLDKFKILVQIDARVKLEKLDIDKLPSSTKELESIANGNKNDFAHVQKACPASQKYRFT